MKRDYKRVILLGVDGAGIFFKQAQTPNIDRIMENGCVTYNGLTAFPSISGECWGAMLHGVDPEVHKLTNSVVSSQKFDVKSPYPSFFRVIREHYPEAKLASFSCWSPINYGIVEDNLDVHMDSAGDDVLNEKIIDYINNNDFDTMFVQFDSVDGAGHRNGYGTEGHLAQITVVDGYIGRICETLKARGMYDDTLVIVTADHGGTPYGNHGGDSDAEMMIYIGVAGKTVKPGIMDEGREVSVKAIPAIVLYAMGLEVPDSWSARLPEGVFEEQEKARLFKRVVLFGVDGAGTFFREADTPVLDKIFGNGSVTYNGRTVLPSISAQCWGSLLHGVDPQVHEMTNSSVEAKATDCKPKYPSFFSVIRDNYPEAKLVYVGDWAAIANSMVEANVGLHSEIVGKEHIAEAAVKYVENNDFDVLFVYFEDVDLKGHHNGYGSPAHLDQITKTDKYIGEIYDALEKRGMVEDTLFLVSPDHGGTPYGNHGGDSDAEVNIMIGAAGKGVIKGTMGNGETVSIKSIPAMILYAFGLGTPETWTANVPDNVFENYNAKKHIKVNDVQPVTKEIIDGGLIATPIWYEGSMIEYMNPEIMETVGNVKFGEAIHDPSRPSVDLSECYSYLQHYKLGADSFAVGVRIKYKEIRHDAVLFSNSDAMDPNGNGFSAILKKDGVLFRIGNGQFGQEFMLNLPHKPDKWNSIIISVDRPSMTVTAYYDFKLVQTAKIDERLKKCGLDAYGFGIGMDGKRTYPEHLEALVHELYIIRTSLSEKDVLEVKRLYE